MFENREKLAVQLKSLKHRRHCFRLPKAWKNCFLKSGFVKSKKIKYSNLEYYWRFAQNDSLQTKALSFLRARLSKCVALIFSCGRIRGPCDCPKRSEVLFGCAVARSTAAARSICCVNQPPLMRIDLIRQERKKMCQSTHRYRLLASDWLAALQAA